VIKTSFLEEAKKKAEEEAKKAAEAAKNADEKGAEGARTFGGKVSRIQVSSKRSWTVEKAKKTRRFRRRIDDKELCG
jgi:membrane protein involved in colicin uptake